MQSIHITVLLLIRDRVYIKVNIFEKPVEKKENIDTQQNILSKNKSWQITKEEIQV